MTRHITRDRVAIAAAVAAPLAAAAILLPLRGSWSNTNVALLRLVVVVVAVAAIGNRTAGALVAPLAKPFVQAGGQGTLGGRSRRSVSAAAGTDAWLRLCGARGQVVGAENAVTICDLGIFADQTAEPVPPQDPDIRAHSGRTLTSGGRALAERPVRAMNVIVLDVLTQDQPQVPLAGDQHPVQALAPGAGNPPLRDRIRPGRSDMRLDNPPTAVNTASKAAANLVSRSRIRNLKSSAWPSRVIRRLRACWVTHSPVGWAVIPARCTRRVPCSMKNSTCRRRRNTVSTWKKSAARMVFA
jgi:hypothetical protein